MGIVTLYAIGLRERLALVSLDNRGIAGIVTIEAQRWSGFGQVIGKLRIRLVTCFVSDVTGIAAKVEGRVAAAIR
jgi:hypothetical protein